MMDINQLLSESTEVPAERPDENGSQNLGGLGFTRIPTDEERKLLREYMQRYADEWMAAKSATTTTSPEGE